MADHFKTYFIWLGFTLVAAFSVNHISPNVAAILMLRTIIVPGDRIRIKMIKDGKSIPHHREGWSLVVLRSFIPFTWCVYTSAVVDLEIGQHRANLVVGAIAFWGLFTFGLNTLLFRSKTYWSNTSNRINAKKAVSENDV